jgi:protein-S-isoprenylcysteine O-methyltransferase Ste14
MAEAAKPDDRGGLGQGARYIAQRMFLFAVFGAILFGAAGKVAWLRGWAYLLITLGLEIGTLVILARIAPETIRQRGAGHSGVKGFDKAFAGAWLLLALVTPLVAGLDERHQWSSIPMAALYISIVPLIIASGLGGWAMVENEHFEQFVRIQVDRAHRVVTSGPYRIIRHPGYAGFIIGALVTPLMLGSWWTFGPAGALILLLIIRTALEDGTLRRELEGYEAYAQRTRWRLLPGVW